jgi:hypothetical protein
MAVRAVVIGSLTSGWGLYLSAPPVAAVLAALALWGIVEGTVLL